MQDVKTNRTRLTSQGVVADNMSAFVEFLENTDTRDKSDEVRLLKRIFEMHDDFRTLENQQRTAIREQVTEMPLSKKRITL